MTDNKPLLPIELKLLYAQALGETHKWLTTSGDCTGAGEAVRFAIYVYLIAAGAKSAFRNPMRESLSLRPLMFPDVMYRKTLGIGQSEDSAEYICRGESGKGHAYEGDVVTRVDGTFFGNVFPDAPLYRAEIPGDAARARLVWICHSAGLTFELWAEPLPTTPGAGDLERIFRELERLRRFFTPIGYLLQVRLG